MSQDFITMFYVSNHIRAIPTEARCPFSGIRSVIKMLNDLTPRSKSNWNAMRDADAEVSTICSAKTIHSTHAQWRLWDAKMCLQDAKNGTNQVRRGARCWDAQHTERICFFHRKYAALPYYWMWDERMKHFRRIACLVTTARSGDNRNGDATQCERRWAQHPTMCHTSRRESRIFRPLWFSSLLLSAPLVAKRYRRENSMRYVIEYWFVRFRRSVNAVHLPIGLELISNVVLDHCFLIRNTEHMRFN